MLSSRASMLGLLAISQDDVYKQCVQEIIIGPERLRKSSSWILPADYGYYSHIDMTYFHYFKTVYDRLYFEQEAYMRSGQTEQILRQALANFPNIKRVKIESYPNDGPTYHEHDSLLLPWGAYRWTIKVLEATYQWRQEGQYDPTHMLKTNPALIFYEDHGSSMIHWHVNGVFRALSNMSNRRWDLHLSINSSREYPNMQIWPRRAQVFNLASDPWTPLRHRVRTLYLCRSIVDRSLNRHARSAWLVELASNCYASLQSLHCEHTLYWPQIFTSVPLPALRHIRVEHTEVEDYYLNKFLIAQTSTLKSIVFDNITLSAMTHSLTDSHADYDYGEEDPSWLLKFDIMHEMPRLEVLELSSLSWLWHESRNVELVDCRAVGRVAPWGPVTRYSRRFEARGPEIRKRLRAACRHNAVEFIPKPHMPPPYVVFKCSEEDEDEEDEDGQ